MARFGAAFDRQDLDAVLAAMTPDCVFESTEEEIVSGDRMIVRWRDSWPASADGGPGNTAGHVRGIDVFRVRDGLVAEKFSYVKG